MLNMFKDTKRCTKDIEENNVEIDVLQKELNKLAKPYEDKITILKMKNHDLDVRIKKISEGVNVKLGKKNSKLGEKYMDPKFTAEIYSSHQPVVSFYNIEDGFEATDTDDLQSLYLVHHNLLLHIKPNDYGGICCDQAYWDGKEFYYHRWSRWHSMYLTDRARRIIINGINDYVANQAIEKELLK